MTVIGSAHIFADKKPLRKKLHSTLHNWFFNPEVFKKQAEYKSDNKEQTPTIELGFIEKLIEMFKYRRILRDLKQDIEQQNGLSNGYVRTEGKLVVDLMLTYRSTHLQRIFAPRIKELDANVQRLINKARFENYVVVYNALRCQCELEYDLFMNVKLWRDILENICDRTHSQYGMVAIIRAVMIILNKEIWKAFLECRFKVIEKSRQKKISKINKKVVEINALA